MYRYQTVTKAVVVITNTCARFVVRSNTNRKERPLELSPEAFDELDKRLSEPPKFLPRLAELLKLTSNINRKETK